MFPPKKDMLGCFFLAGEEALLLERYFQFL